MNQSRVAPWLWLAPLAGWAVLAASLLVRHPLFALLEGAALIACVLAAVHHAEVVAHRVGEPFGTLLLALAVTVIEVALIVSLMVGPKEDWKDIIKRTEDTGCDGLELNFGCPHGMCDHDHPQRHGGRLPSAGRHTTR